MTRQQKAAFKAQIMRSIAPALASVMPGTLDVRFSDGQPYMMLVVREGNTLPTYFHLSIKESQ